MMLLTHINYYLKDTIFQPQFSPNFYSTRIAIKDMKGLCCQNEQRAYICELPVCIYHIDD